MTNSIDTHKRNTLTVLQQLRTDLVTALVGKDDGYHLERKTRLETINKRIEEVEGFDEMDQEDFDNAIIDAEQKVNAEYVAEKKAKEPTTWGDRMEASGFDWTNLPETDGRELTRLIPVAGYIMSEIKSFRGIEQIDMTTAIGAYYNLSSKRLGKKSDGNFLCQKLIIEVSTKLEHLYEGTDYDEATDSLVRKTLVSDRLVQKVKKATETAIDHRLHRPRVSVSTSSDEDFYGKPIIKIVIASLNNLKE